MQTSRFRVSELREHPQQSETYADLNEHEFESLKRDIQTRGVRQPIEVTLNGMIVDGHQRVRACRELGIEEIDAVICQDDAQDEIDRSFVLANLLRRHLDPIAKARALSTLVAIERRQLQDTGTEFEGDLRDRIAEMLGGKMSGRTLDRYLQFNRLPSLIQQAVVTGDLPMTRALLVEKLSSAQQQQIVDRIESGEEARTVVDSFFPRRNSNAQDSPSDLYRMLVGFLDENISVMASEHSALAGTAGNHDETVTILEQAEEFFRTMQDVEKRAQHDSLEAIRAMI